MPTPIEIKNINAIVTYINNRKETAVDWNEVTRRSGTTKRTFQRRVKEAGYIWSKSEERYIKTFDSAINEVAVSLETNDNKSVPEWAMEDNDTPIKVEIDNDKGEFDLEDKDKARDDFEAVIKEVVDSFDAKEELVTLSTYIPKDVNEALNEWAKGKPRGAKQKLVTGLLKVALKDYLEEIK